MAARHSALCLGRTNASHGQHYPSLRCCDLVLGVAIGAHGTALCVRQLHGPRENSSLMFTLEMIDDIMHACAQNAGALAGSARVQRCQQRTPVPALGCYRSEDTLLRHGHVGRSRQLAGLSGAVKPSLLERVVLPGARSVEL